MSLIEQIEQILWYPIKVKSPDHSEARNGGISILKSDVTMTLLPIYFDNDIFVLNILRNLQNLKSFKVTSSASRFLRKNLKLASAIF